LAFNDEITQVIFNPYWNIRQALVKNEIKPAMEKRQKLSDEQRKWKLLSRMIVFRRSSNAWQGQMH
jgi:hypothetical protein